MNQVIEQPRPRVHKPRPIPDLDRLPADALLTRNQLVALTGFALVTIQKWAADGGGRGPKITTVNGNLPRYRAADVRAWIRGDGGTVLGHDGFL